MIGKGELRLFKESCSVNIERGNTREIKSKGHKSTNDEGCMCHAEELELILPRTEEPPNSFKPGHDITTLSFLKTPFCLHQRHELK